jgi:hypothetical protein
MKLADATTLVSTCRDPKWREPVLLPLPVRLRLPQPGVPEQKMPLGGLRLPERLQVDAEGVDVR